MRSGFAAEKASPTLFRKCSAKALAAAGVSGMASTGIEDMVGVGAAVMTVDDATGGRTPGLPSAAQADTGSDASSQYAPRRIFTDAAYRVTPMTYRPVDSLQAGAPARESDGRSVARCRRSGIPRAQAL